MNRKLSFVFFFTVVLCLAFLQGCTTPDPLADCDKIEDQLYKNDCYVQVAKDKQDLSICDQIQDPINKTFCYKAVAIVAKDVSVCDKFRVGWGVCYTAVARATKDPSLCEKIQEAQESKDICYASVERAINGP